MKRTKLSRLIALFTIVLLLSSTIAYAEEPDVEHVAEPDTEVPDPEDTTGLLYYNARYYDPELRQFTQPDTVLPNIYDPQLLNRYAYARNNPLKYVDETGHYIDTILDIASITVSIHDLIDDPTSGWNWLALGADGVTTLLPLVAGGGLFVKGVIKGEKIIDAGSDVIKGVENAKKVESSHELFKIDELYFTHKNDDIPNILKNQGNKPLDTPVDIWQIKDKQIVMNGVGRTTRRIEAGYDTVPGKLDFNIPDISQVPKNQQKYLDNLYEKSAKMDIAATQKKN